jgi:PDZ domain-containing secreted protein
LQLRASCPFCRRQNIQNNVRQVIYEIKEKTFKEIFDDDQLRTINDNQLLKENYAKLYDESKKLKDMINLLNVEKKQTKDEFEGKLKQKESEIVIIILTFSKN